VSNTLKVLLPLLSVAFSVLLARHFHEMGRQHGRAEADAEADIRLAFEREQRMSTLQAVLANTGSQADARRYEGPESALPGQEQDRWRADREERDRLRRDLSQLILERDRLRRKLQEASQGRNP
jgi:hypothetical protein